MMRSFLILVLYWTGLTVNEDYAIIQECYPYLARRLFTDNSPRSKAALREMLLGAPSNTIDGKNDAILSPNKLIEMSTGFTSYTASTGEVDQEGKGSMVSSHDLLKFQSLFLLLNTQ